MTHPSLLASSLTPERKTSVNDVTRRRLAESRATRRAAYARIVEGLR